MKDDELWGKEINKCRKIEKLKKNINTIHCKKLINIAEIVRKIKQKTNTNYKEQDFTDIKQDFYSLKTLNKNETLGINRNTDKKLIRGKYKIDRKIDLHGKTLKESFELLFDLINDSYNKKLRCLLIITGKGNGSKIGSETIKSSIGSWLKYPELSSKIIKYTEATKNDGGSGAIYILLKRNKTLDCFDKDDDLY